MAFKYTYSYLTVCQNLSMILFSRQQPLPSMVIWMSWDFKRSVNFRMNRLPLSMFMIPGTPYF